MDMVTISFYILAAIVLFSAFRVAFSTNLVHSALFMVLSFLGTAGIFILLYADFLAVVQVLVYVGAISVLMVFGVMLTKRGDITKSNLFNKYKVPAGIVAGLMFLVITASMVFSSWKESSAEVPQNTVEQVAGLMLNEYAVPFEIAGILLLIAVIGAIVVSKGVSNSK